MKRLLAALVLAAFVLVLAVHLTATAADKDKAAEPMIAHDVYFALKDSTPEAKKKLVESCKKYLSKHEGTVFFATGTRAEDFNQPVNDKDFDVSLNLVFKNKAAHDKYKVSDLHKQFIAENKDSFKAVRVFDSAVDAVNQ
jgi:hypothetical protein